MEDESERLWDEHHKREDNYEMERGAIHCAWFDKYMPEETCHKCKYFKHDPEGEFKHLEDGDFCKHNKGVL